MDTSSRNEKAQLDKSLMEAKKKMSKCVLDSSWTFTIPSVLIAIPISIKLKTYAPLVVGGGSASGLDYYYGTVKCQKFADDIHQIKLRIAMLEHGSPPF